MELNLDDRRLTGDTLAWEVISYLRQNEGRLSLDSANLYYEFPILKDTDDLVVIAKLLLLSPIHGIVIIATADIGRIADQVEVVREADQALEHVFSLVFSKLVRNRQLRRTSTSLRVMASSIVFAPGFHQPAAELGVEASLAASVAQVGECLEQLRGEACPPEVFRELVSTIEGAKGMVRAKPRELSDQGERSRGYLANQIESEISSFYRRQKQGAMAILDGLQRVRGLAGSGKTVVLAMKAAITHLRDPNARIAYTFYTRSLYQHIQRLITRFYRQFEDSDPDWNRLNILHGWGGYTGEGLYFNACATNGVPPVSLSEAQAARAKDPFDFACRQLLEASQIQPMYDYILVDEGQDFPASFIQLCIRLTRGGRVVLAYDDLQTIFQPSTPDMKDIVGADKDGRPLVELTEDTVLYKCYRNPREILVCAHAIGLGIYSNIVQMLENREQWEDIGYRVLSGDFVQGSETVIERPVANSLLTLSANQTPADIVQATAYGSFEDEIGGVVAGIDADIADGLRADDILVIVVDDRNAKAYLRSVASRLEEIGIQSHNIHSGNYGIIDFQREGRVTLSTVHKAKGNEAFMVYVLGVDALYTTRAGVRERNVIFTAMTRAKGWVRISGVGSPAVLFREEVNAALAGFPNLSFTYPSPEQLRIIRRDLAEKDARKQVAERKLDEVLSEMTPDEVARFVAQRSVKKGAV